MILHFHRIIPEGLEKIFLIYIIKTMTVNDQIRDEKRQYDTDRKAAEISALHQVKSINMNILLVKIYYDPISNK